MYFNSHQVEQTSIIKAAQRMCVAARTAQKSKGMDKIATAVVTDNEKNYIADEMEKIPQSEGIDFFMRDAENIRQSAVLSLIGTILNQRGVKYCGQCGFKNCREKINKGGVCVFDTIDLGLLSELRLLLQLMTG